MGKQSVGLLATLEFRAGWRLLAGLLLCGFFRRGAERADEETQHADAAPNCGLRAEVQRLDEWGRSRAPGS
jgi:hypothetical protein